ncbi:MAG: hypothetical protein GWN79_15895, partial [Actinobacteria bacterium]|nr:hypothetical protein [Actinomycetota bacterium]NIS33283.1 hypothetical protein [Actinomycetota bacterium]NIT96780.1 hypothetical protein [Actinomycetota bacterium]NIU20464.1 hypothetical protein [Actinomycetota bacterium]NIU68189.1 hypothetical protein [Actinomycetota bacterium]
VATEERFVTVDDVGWYRTGDLVREVDGVVRFLGRTDDQLNVGGVRAEPAEIERELDSLPSVDASVVVAVGTPAVLVAHVVVEDPSAFDEADLRRRLGDRLPTALVPRRFVVQPSLPLSANGKLDRAAARLLPEPVSSEPPAASPSAPGGSRLAEEIMAAWRSALAPAPIELDTDFFEAGGDSLSAVEIVTDLGDRLGHDVAIATLLSGRTPGGMAAALQPLAGHESVIRPVRFRPGRPDGPVIVMTPSWDDVFGYQALAEAFPDEFEVVALAYDVQPGQVPVNRVPELVTEMVQVFATLDTTDRPVAILGWSIGGVSATELAARLHGAGARVDAAVLVDTFFPGEERHLWSNRWWKYKSMIRRGAGPELRKEVRLFLARRSPRKWAARLGRRLLRWSGTEPLAPTAAPPMVGSFPAEAFGHQPTPPGVPVVLYRASTTNPARTIARWRTVAPDIVDVEVEGRHRGFDSIMHAG